MVTSATRKQQVDLPLDEARARMRGAFGTKEASDYHDGWSALWDAGDFLPWDRMVPNPALADTLINHSHVVGGYKLTLPDGSLRRKRALVPGCGRGVDVMLLQSFGYDVVGLEYSATAKAEAERYAEETENEQIYALKKGVESKGTRQFVQGDFFKDDWLAKVGFSETEGVFDLIYDYTFFCAMQLSMRPAWAQRMTTLLAKHTQANLICLEFPTTKPASTGGPPNSSPPKAYMEHLSHPGVDIPYTAGNEVLMRPMEDSSSGALERVGHWHPAETHQIGKSASGEIEDYVSVWRHK